MHNNWNLAFNYSIYEKNHEEGKKDILELKDYYVLILFSLCY
jgi:hypothetical protein